MIPSGRAGVEDNVEGWPAIAPYTVPANLLIAEEESVPTADEIQQWEALPVRTFRRKLAPYLFINAVVALFALFFMTGGLMWWTFGHTVYMARQYAKLRDAGFDWRDVFRQPPERELIDVVEDAVAYVKRLFNPAERARMREERTARAVARRLSGRTGAIEQPRRSGPHTPPRPSSPE